MVFKLQCLCFRIYNIYIYIYIYIVYSFVQDLPLFDGSQSTKLKGLEAAIVIKKEFEEVAKRKIMLSGDEDWDEFDEQEKDTGETSTVTNPNKDTKQKKTTKISKKKLKGTTFENRLADEEEEWLGVEKDAWKKIRNMEKQLKKLQD